VEKTVGDELKDIAIADPIIKGALSRISAADNLNQVTESLRQLDECGYFDLDFSGECEIN
jgi:hypothetical protein